MSCCCQELNHTEVSLCCPKGCIFPCTLWKGLGLHIQRPQLLMFSSCTKPDLIPHSWHRMSSSSTTGHVASWGNGVVQLQNSPSLSRATGCNRPESEDQDFCTVLTVFIQPLVFLSSGHFTTTCNRKKAEHIIAP